MDILINPWDHQPGEGTKAFEAFKTYRDMGPKRTIMAAVKIMTGKDNTRGRMDVWSTQNDWVNRVQSYDRWMDQQYTNKLAEEVREMAARHASMAVVFMNKVVQRLQNVDPATLSNDQLLRWFEISSKIERISRGESTENVRTEHSGTIKAKVDLSKLSNDDLDEVNRIFIRATNSRAIAGRVLEAETVGTDPICD